MLTEIKSFLIGHKGLCFFGLLNPCSYVLWPLNTLVIPQGLAGVEAPWARGLVTSPPLTREGPGLLTRQIVVLAVGLGRDGHYLLIVFGTYCVILEEIKGTYQP